MTFFKHYRNNIRFIITLSIALMSTISFAQVEPVPIVQSTSPTNFTHFLQHIKDKEPTGGSTKSITAYQSDSPLTTIQQHQIYHLLGRYTQEKYGQRQSQHYNS